MSLSNRVELKLDDPNLMRNSSKTRMIASSSAPWTRLPSCRTVVFLFGWLLTIVVISFSDIYTSQLDKELATTVSCDGRLVYVYNLSEVYNREFVQQCTSFKKGRDLCMYMENGGLGREFRFGAEHGGPEEEKGPAAWYNTWQFALELYFHERLVRLYPCLTDREDRANVFYLPYYAGMDLSRRFTHRLAKGELYLELAKWLRERRSWQRRRGRDHFIALGRIASDFRQAGGDRAWGNEMLRQEAFKEMVVLSIERSSRRFLDSLSAEKEIAVPYPTSFHARSSNGELRSLLHWLRQRSQRVSLVTMAAGPRRFTTNKLRHLLMTQCGEDPRCTLLVCVGHEASPDLATQISHVSLPVKLEGKTLEVSCNNPRVLLSAMHQSVFCLQPPGDSPTRRSFFDAMLAGCIPVIFRKEAAWSQYVHHLPEHGASFSVLIPMKVASKSNIINVLSEVGESKISEMQANLAKLVPRILYSRLHEIRQEVPPPSTPPDAFDIAMEAVLARINSLTNNETSSWRFRPRSRYPSTIDRLSEAGVR